MKVTQAENDRLPDSLALLHHGIEPVPSALDASGIAAGHTVVAASIQREVEP
jgi:hypothetical protein